MRQRQERERRRELVREMREKFRERREERARSSAMASRSSNTNEEGGDGDSNDAIKLPVPSIQVIKELDKGDVDSMDRVIDDDDKEDDGVVLSSSPRSTASSPGQGQTIVSDCERDSRSNSSALTEIISHDVQDVKFCRSHARDNSIVEKSPDSSTSPKPRQCIVCLASKSKTADVFTGRYVRREIDMLLHHLDVPMRGNSSNTGLCYDCMEQLQRWHAFYTTRRRFLDLNPPKEEDLNHRDLTKVDATPVKPEPPLGNVFYSSRKLLELKEIYEKSKFLHCVERDWDERDLEFLCYQICHMESLASPAVKDLELYFINDKKLLKMHCNLCNELVPGGKGGYISHMAENHKQHPAFFPCDICGECFPDKEFALVDDYFTHWLGHFYFFSCEECGIVLPTLANLTQHQAVWHKKSLGKKIVPEAEPMIVLEPEPVPVFSDSSEPDDGEKGQNFSRGVVMPKGKFEKGQRLPYVVCKICGERVQRPFVRLHEMRHEGKGELGGREIQNNYKEANAVGKTAAENIQAMNVAGVQVVKNSTVQNATTDAANIGRKLFYRYKCRFCPRKYYRQDHLDDHERFVHLNIKNHVCSVCNKPFVNTASLMRHEQSHVGLATFDCTTCSRKYLSKKSLSHHNCKGMKIKTPQLYKCEVCFKIFKHLQSYTNHTTLHTNVRDHKCEICGLEFRLLRHLREHSQRRHQLSIEQDEEEDQFSGTDNDASASDVIEIPRIFSRAPPPPRQRDHDPMLSSAAITPLTPTSDDKDPFSFNMALW